MRVERVSINSYRICFTSCGSRQPPHLFPHCPRIITNSCKPCRVKPRDHLSYFIRYCRGTFYLIGPHEGVFFLRSCFTSGVTKGRSLLHIVNFLIGKKLSSKSFNKE